MFAKIRNKKQTKNQKKHKEFCFIKNIVYLCIAFEKQSNASLAQLVRASDC